MTKKTSSHNSSRVHIISRKQDWAVKKEGASRASKIYSNKDTAIKSTEKLRNTGHDIIIHKKDGTIQDWKKANN